MSLTTPLYHLAFIFLQTHEGEHLAHDQHRLVSRCIDHLVLSSEVSADTAKDVTMQALGELTSRRRREYIDCTRTTSYTLFLVDATGQRRAFLLSELLQLIEQAKAAPST